jgi:hypothetical protein
MKLELKHLFFLYLCFNSNLIINVQQLKKKVWYLYNKKHHK